VTGGLHVRIRPLRATDERVLQDLFYRLSDRSTYQRFLGHKRRYPHEEIARLADFSDTRDAALVATSADECEELIAMARYDVDPSTGNAEVALVVRDEWQRKGVGSALFRCLVKLARKQGVSAFTADVLASNGPMLSVFRASGFPIESRLDAGVYHIDVRLAS
jgi:GNAT superfamily N-acetyltransferase